MEEKPAQNLSFFPKQGQVYAWLTILVVVIVAALAYYFLQVQTTPKETSLITKPAAIEKPLVKVGTGAEISGIFPSIQMESHDFAFSANIFEGLVLFRNGKIVAGLATGWSNPDNSTWRFKLRSGVTFQNGNKFVAEDVKYSIEQSKAKNWPDIIPGIKSVSIIDPSTVEIKTTEPDPILLAKLVNEFIISKQQAEKEGFDKLVGTGPYKLKSFEKDVYTIELNENYWGGKPKIKEVVYKYVLPDQTTKSLLGGDIDVISAVSSVDNQKLLQNGFSIKSFDLPVVFDLEFDLAKNKTPYVNTPKNPFKDRLVRQALLYGINIDEFIKNSVSDAEPASQLVTSSIFGFDPNIKRPAYDLAKAKQLLSDAGYPNGFSVTVDVPIAYQTDKEIVRQLQRLGIDAKSRIVADDKDFARLDSGDFSLRAYAYAAETLDLGDLLDGILHTKTETKGQENSTGYSNSAVDKLIDQASEIFNPKDRLGLLQKADKAALDDIAFIPLYSTKNFGVVRAGFDWTPHNFGLIYAYEIEGR